MPATEKGLLVTEIMAQTETKVFLTVPWLSPPNPSGEEYMINVLFRDDRRKFTTLRLELPIKGKSEKDPLKVDLKFLKLDADLEKSIRIHQVSPQFLDLSESSEGKMIASTLGDDIETLPPILVISYGLSEAIKTILIMEASPLCTCPRFNATYYVFPQPNEFVISRFVRENPLGFFLNSDAGQLPVVTY